MLPDDCQPRPAGLAPEYSDIEAAARRIAGHATVTPLLESRTLNAASGGRILIKAEPLQRTGSFKFRGAMSRLSRLSPEARSRGVVAWSSGNPAQAVAAAAALRGIAATIVMPADAPAVKLAGTRDRGAEIVPYDRAREDREAIARDLAATRGATLLPPYNDPDVIAGQGTLARELYRQARQMDAAPDLLLVPCGGGGLAAGCALATAALSPATRLHTVEPAGFDDTARSLAAGERLENPAGATSFCDALLAKRPGELTFPVLQRLAGPGLVVDDAAVARAMAAAFRHLRLVVEPGGAVALAAALSGLVDLRGRTVAVIASGGNVDPSVFRALLET